jgi:hypothetical protein
VGLGDPDEETDAEAVVLGVPLGVSEGVAGINKRVVLGVAVILGVPVFVGVFDPVGEGVSDGDVVPV